MRSAPAVMNGQSSAAVDGEGRADMSAVQRRRGPIVS